jgi:magnesium transporter
MSWIQMMRPILSLSQDLKAEVISELNDLEHDIVDLLRYDENSAGD